MGTPMKLADWLDGTDLVPPQPRMTRAAFASEIGASVTLITAYCNESVWPGRDKMAAMVDVTKGAVTPNDFLRPKSMAAAE